MKVPLRVWGWGSFKGLGMVLGCIRGSLERLFQGLFGVLWVLRPKRDVYMASLGNLGPKYYSNQSEVHTQE